MHLGLKPFRCQRCGKVFAREREVLRHASMSRRSGGCVIGGGGGGGSHRGTATASQWAESAAAAESSAAAAASPPGEEFDRLAALLCTALPPLHAERMEC